MQTTKGSLTIYHRYSSLKDEDVPACDPKTTLIRFENCRLPFFPVTIIEKQRDLVELDIRNVKLQDINPKTFLCATKLKVIDLSGNELRFLESYTFAGLANLEELNLSGNKIEIIAPGTFNELSKLKAINLSKNRLSKLPADVFRGNSQLARCDIHENEIVTIDPKMFIENIRLNKLNLAKNKLMELVLEFPNNSLTILDASQNSLRRLDLWANNRTISVNLHLLVQNNQLETILVIEFAVKLLNMSSNKMNDLKFLDSFEFDSITWLDISQNNVQIFDTDLISRLIYLSYLSLEGNKVKELPEDADHANLTELNLARNEIRHVDASDIQKRFPKVSTLDLRGNTLDSLSKCELTNQLGIKVFFDGILARVESFDDLLDDDGNYLHVDDEFDDLSIMSERDDVPRKIEFSSSFSTDTLMSMTSERSETSAIGDTTFTDESITEKNYVKAVNLRRDEVNSID